MRFPKRTLFLLLVINALMGILPTFAQSPAPFPGAAWTLSLYNQPTGTIKRVSPAGEEAAEVTLPIPEGFDFYDYNLIVSSARELAGYLVSQVGDGSNPVQPTKLLVYNVPGFSLPVSFDLDTGITREGINAAGSSLRFNDEGTRILTAYYFPHDAFTNGVQVVALDTMTGGVVNALTSDYLIAGGVKPNEPYYTQVLAFQGDTALLILHPVFVSDNTPSIGLSWNVATNAITAMPEAFTNAVDYDAQTNDVVLLTYDPAVDALAAGESTPEDAILSPNTVQLYDISTGDTRTIYSEDTNIVGAKFVQSGTRILVFTGSGARGVLIGQDGAKLSEFEQLPGADFTFGVSDGFVYGDPQQTGTFVHVKTDDNSFTPTTFYTTSSPFTSYSVQNYSPAASTG
jgi:hypothetical protein